jgi:hypothetical protein
MNNGYTFAHKGREGAKGDEGLAPTARRYEPVTDMGLQDVLVWLNAYSQKA